MSKLAWKEINWILVQKRLSKQQRRVYKASMEGKHEIVQALQRRIIGSMDAKLLAVKRVTTENQGRNTPGIDYVKALSHENKIELAYKLKLDGKSKTISKLYIPKIKTKKKRLRPLGILIIEDKAKQMLAKLALEPEWEAIFESNSYGFRSGRSCHDGLASLFLVLRGKTPFILKTSIHKCFDEINYDKLLIKLNTFDQMENQIKVWLETGIMVNFKNKHNELRKVLEGIPQETIISSLMANIVLHGLENHIKDWYVNIWYSISRYPSSKGKRDRRRIVGFSRYADDFLITAPTFIDIVEIKKVVNKWLIKEVGLKLSKTRTRIVNLTSGFEFLGFQIISIKIGKRREYKVKISPSKQSKNLIIEHIRKIIQRNKSTSSYVLIKLLANRIVGWANYFNFREYQKVFSKIDCIIFKQIKTWVFRRKSKGLRSQEKLKEKYFPSGNIYTFRDNQYKNDWILTGNIRDKEKKYIKQNFLPKISWISPIRHIKIEGNTSSFDSNYLYWTKRILKDSNFSNNVSKLI